MPVMSPSAASSSRKLGWQDGGSRADVLLQVDRLRLRQVHPLVY